MSLDNRFVQEANWTSACRETYLLSCNWGVIKVKTITLVHQSKLLLSSNSGVKIAPSSQSYSAVVKFSIVNQEVLLKNWFCRPLCPRRWVFRFHVLHRLYQWQRTLYSLPIMSLSPTLIFHWIKKRNKTIWASQIEQFRDAVLNIT